MRGEFNGSNALILKENSSTYKYIVLLTKVVAVAKKHLGVGNFFDMLAMVMHVVNASCKRKDMIRESYKDMVQEAIGKTEIRKGLNQKFSLIRAEDARWGSHH